MKHINYYTDKVLVKLNNIGYYNAMENILPKGTEIRCPRKRHLIGTLNKDLRAGEVLGVKGVDFESEQERIAGEPCGCKRCGSLYFVQNNLYTDSGWQPNEPQLETVTRR